MKSVGVTGVTGFVGQRFMECNRERYRLLDLNLRAVSPDKMDVRGLDAIVHLAGKAHQMEPIDDKIYFDVNYELTLQLAARAREQGVGQFIYISSTKVYGDNPIGKLDESSECHPDDAYGFSKLKAEKALLAMQSSGFTVAIVRPPLVYGPRVKGNMIRLLHLAAKKYPLPLGHSRNARSMVFVDNLVALINTLIDKKAPGVFIAGDEKPVETSALIKMMRVFLDNGSPLISIPQPFRLLIKKLKPALYVRLFGSFVVDNESTNNSLGFRPPFSTEQGVSEMVSWFKMKNLL